MSYDIVKVHRVWNILPRKRHLRCKALGYQDFKFVGVLFQRDETICMLPRSSGSSSRGKERSGKVKSRGVRYV